MRCGWSLFCFCSLLGFLLPLIMELNQDNRSPVTTQRCSRQSKISVTRRSSSEPVRQGRRRFMTYAMRLRTFLNNSHAGWVLSPWRPLPSRTSALLWSTNHKTMVWRNVSKWFGSSWLLETFQGSKIYSFHVWHSASSSSTSFFMLPAQDLERLP